MRTILLLSALVFVPIVAAENAGKPRHSLPAQYAEIADQTDYAIARFMQANCKDREEAILYVPRTKTIVRVGKNATIGGVEYDAAAMRKTIRLEPNIVEVHCHVINLEAIANAEPDFKKVLQQIGFRETRERFWAEIPSPGDITIARGIEAKVLAKHPGGSVEHRIVVVEPGLPPHVLSYGLAPGEKEGLREIVRKKKYNTDAMMEYDSQYTHPLSRLDADRCKPSVLEPSCVLRSAREAAKIINENNLFFVHDRGYLERLP
jgi:hypothetical protein